MADNVTLSQGTADGAVLATDDAAGVHHPYVKVEFGADNTQTPVSSANPLPATLLASATNIAKAEDAAHQAGDTGAMVLAIRDDTLDARSGTENDYEPLHTNANGALWTDPVDRAARDNGKVDIAAVDVTVTVDGSGVTQPVSHAALTELAAAIDTEVQCDIVGALPAGTNNIGDVDVLSVVPGTAATNLGKAEDAQHSTGDVGVMALGVRQSSQADFGADGDYVPFSVDDDGGLRVSIVAGAGSGGTAQADDADFTAGTTQGTPAMGVYEVTPSSVTDGDLGTVGITETRAVRVAIEEADGTPVEPLPLYTEDAAAAGDPEGPMNMLVVDTAGNDTVSNDGDNIAWRANANGAGWVDMTDRAARDLGKVDIAAFDVALGTVTTVTTVSTLTGGGIAHDSADSGNPHKVGFRAVDLGATPTAVTAADRSDWLGLRCGIPFVLNGHPNQLTASIQVTDGDGAQTDTAIVTVSAGTAVVVLGVDVTADNANTGDVSVRVGFGTANTPAADAAAQLLFHPGIAPGSGMVKGCNGSILGIGASNEDVRVTCEDPAGGSVNVIVHYFTIAIG